MSGTESHKKFGVSIRCLVKGYQECLFDVIIGEKFIATKKHGRKGQAFKVCNERGQLGHLQREVVSLLWPLNEPLNW